MDHAEEKTLTERAFERIDVRAELDRLETSLAELKVCYEQHFLGILPLAPDRLHTVVKASFRKLRKAPFKSSALNFRLRALENRYQAFHTYWQRVLKEREDGTYNRDVFKAEMRAKNAIEDTEANSVRGAAHKGMKDLFDTYRSAIERQAGKSVDLDFSAFQKSLVERAKEFKEKHSAAKLTFSVVVKDGKVLLQAKAK